MLESFGERAAMVERYAVDRLHIDNRLSMQVEGITKIHNALNPTDCNGPSAYKTPAPDKSWVYRVGTRVPTHRKNYLGEMCMQVRILD